MLPAIRSRLDGPPFALPALLDRLAERWWAAPPRLRALAVAGAAALLLLAGLTQAATGPHGPPVEVRVAARDLPVGHVVTSGDTVRRSWPRDLVPDGAVTDATGTVVGALPRGAVVTDRHLSTEGLGAAVADDRVAVAVPLDLLPPVSPGLRLDLVGAELDGRPVVLATDAVVVTIDTASVWLAVDHDDAPAVAAAGLTGAVGAVVRSDR